MTQALADTSVFIARESGRPLRADAMPSALAVSVITIGELRAGVLAADDLGTRNLRLATLTRALALQPLPVDAAVADAWAALRVELRQAGRSMPVNDSWIAATAISLGLPIVSRHDDYADVPGLEVILV